MSYKIAITGKGGTGKTTAAGLIISAMIKNGNAPVLAVDADPNSCLDGVLGVRIKKSVGRVREEVRDRASENAASGIAKREWLELKISESLVESDGFDLIAMGRPEGPGCYCFANNVLKDIIKEISNSYPYIVIDNEAGLENLSRRIVQKVDLLIMVGDPSLRGIETIRRLYDLAKEMKIEYDKLAVIVNRIKGDTLPESATKILMDIHPDFIIAMPDDEELALIAEKGERIQSLPENNQAYGIIDEFIKKVFVKK